jgi:crotonobetainyl-CoA:carnitine CoA-transferase CaiB-like acyl-CoA transferase
VRVLDLSREISGPYAAKLLADAGAEVWKLEAPEGDPLRRFTASRTELAPGADGALFQFLNASKRGADPARPNASACARERRRDLLIEDLGAAVERTDSAHALHALHPASPVSISPFGLTGPWARRPANDWTLQAAIGITARRGLPERGPIGVGGRVGEWVAGASGAPGALAAWRSARRSGRGLCLDLSVFEAMLLVMTQYHDLNGQFHGGELVQFIDNPSIEPARDGWIGFATVTSQQWQDFCLMIGRLSREDPRTQASDQRCADRPLPALIQADARAHGRRDRRDRERDAAAGRADRPRQEPPPPRPLPRARRLRAPPRRLLSRARRGGSRRADAADRVRPRSASTAPGRREGRPPGGEHGSA